MTFQSVVSREAWMGRGSISAYSPHTPFGWSAISTGAPTSQAWPLANLGIFVPFQINERVVAYEAFCSTGTLTGSNLDIGIYDTAGNRLASTGTTARAGASTWQNINWTDYTIEPGQYYMAMSTNDTSTYFALGLTAGQCQAMGIYEMASAFVLPNPATFAQTTRAYIPVFGFNLKSVSY